MNAATKAGPGRCGLSVVLTLAILLLFATPAAAARTIKANPQRSWGITYLGHWHVGAHPEFGKAVYALGTPSRVANPDSPTCSATWNGLGLTIWFANYGGGASCDDGRAQSAVVKGRRGRATWRTTRGLRVGDSYRKLSRLYPGARRKPGARVIVYQDDPVIGDGSIITALIRNRKVASFRLWIGGAGE
jgi:hypothetical protein